MSSQVYFLAFSPRVILWIKTVCYTRAFSFGVSVSGHHSFHLLLTQITQAKCFLHLFCLDSCSEAVALPLVVSKKLISTMTLIDIWAPSSSISNLLINHMPAYPLQKLIRIICANNQKCNFYSRFSTIRGFNRPQPLAWNLICKHCCQWRKVQYIRNKCFWMLILIDFYL